MLTKGFSLADLQAYIRAKDFNPGQGMNYFYKLVEEAGELSEALRKNKRMVDAGTIKGTIEEELYDVLCCVAAIANIHGIDLEQCAIEKEKWNAEKGKGDSNREERMSVEPLVNYDGKRFRTVRNTPNGEVGGETVFRYHQQGRLVWAEYEGGGILKGHLVAVADPEGNLDMRYHHVNDRHELMTGVCRSRPEILEDGRIRLHEEWEWTCKDRSKGTSIVEEIRK